jgi:hypothetical protein
VAFQEQIRAGPRVKLLRNSRHDRVLCFAVGHSVAFAFQASLDSHEDVRAVRGNGSYGLDASKEQNSICAGISDIRKFLKQLLRKLEYGKATAIEIGEFRRLADEVLRNWDAESWSPKFKERIESALSLLP